MCPALAGRRSDSSCNHASETLVSLATIVLLAATTCTPLSACSGVQPRTHEDHTDDIAQDELQPRGRALLVGISEYYRGGDRSEDWWDLNATSDIDVVRRMLMERFGFQREDIVEITDSQATRNAIIREFERLVARTQPGDVVYFQFSGHGQQAPDYSGEEIDGFAQCIVPFDYISRSDPSQGIRNRDFRRLIAELKRRQPAHVCLVFDCCFAGGQARGGSYLVRGESWRGEQPPLGREIDRAPFAKGRVGIFPARAAAAEGYIVIGASSNDELAYETQDQQSGESLGLLTYALVRAVDEATARTSDSTEPGPTYRALRDRVREIVEIRNAKQRPQFEGELDQVIMSSVIIQQAPFVPFRLSADGMIALDGGRLDDVTIGSEFELYPIGTATFEPDNGLTLATVMDVSLGSATLKPKNRKRLSSAVGAINRGWAVKRRHAFPDHVVKLWADTVELGDDQSQIRRELSRSGLVKFVEQPEDADLRIISRESASPLLDAIVDLQDVPDHFRWLVSRRDGSILVAVTQINRDIKLVARAIEDDNRSRRVLELSSSGRGDVFDIDIQVIPVEIKRFDEAGLVDVVGDDIVNECPDCPLELQWGDHFMLEIRVGTDAPVDPHVAVLNITPDRDVNVLWPPANEEKNKISRDGRWHRLPYPFVWRVEASSVNRYGMHAYAPVNQEEYFKAVATQSYIPFHLLEQGRGASMKGERGALARLFMAAMTATRSELATVVPEYWSTDTAQITVAR